MTIVTTLLNKYPVAKVPVELYHTTYFRDFFAHDESTKGLYFDVKNLINDQINNEKIDCYFIYNEDKTQVIGLASAFGNRFNSYFVQHVIIQKAYRKQGIYTAFIKFILDFTSENHFAKVEGTHSPSNNAILIAKLKLGFHITSLEVDPQWGINIRTTYFHNQDLKNAFLLRCGEIHMTQNLFDNSLGSAKKLADTLLEFKD